MAKPMRVLFVCLGNICRSPLAEIIVQGQADKKSMAEMFEFASAGTGDWHVGGRADKRSVAIAKQHGLDLSQHKAQQITGHTIAQWDWFVAMDADNRGNLLAMGVPEHRLLMMRQFESIQGESVRDENVQDVPDPYYGGEDGFEDAYIMLRDNADALLDYLSRQSSD